MVVTLMQFSTRLLWKMIQYCCLTSCNYQTWIEISIMTEDLQIIKAKSLDLFPETTTIPGAFHSECHHWSSENTNVATVSSFEVLLNQLFKLTHYYFANKAKMPECYYLSVFLCHTYDGK